jgi:hypothetical protein
MNRRGRQQLDIVEKNPAIHMPLPQPKKVVCRIQRRAESVAVSLPGVVHDEIAIDPTGADDNSACGWAGVAPRIKAQPLQGSRRQFNPLGAPVALLVSTTLNHDGTVALVSGRHAAASTG